MQKHVHLGLLVPESQDSHSIANNSLTFMPCSRRTLVDLGVDNLPPAASKKRQVVCLLLSSQSTQNTYQSPYNDLYSLAVRAHLLAFSCLLSLKNTSGVCIGCLLHTPNLGSLQMLQHLTGNFFPRKPHFALSPPQTLP